MANLDGEHVLELSAMYRTSSPESDCCLCVYTCTCTCTCACTSEVMLVNSSTNVEAGD